MSARKADEDDLQMVAKQEDQFWPYPVQELKWAWGVRSVMPRG